ncbi:hypothetical protein MTR_0140s0100 [Medicago truncatula]|uniref:Uncharacterized protein n=1 Tax=Medicago truncatula TaxID=3880 RepID=A0A072TGT9_MEDTR|nr:hypothetical protein MTR_0140s0100 [Medicago truncatula]
MASKYSRLWFLKLLLDDIGQEKRWVFISDQQKMFESVEHRLCLRHLYANFKKKFGGGTLIRDLMMGAAKGPGSAVDEPLVIEDALESDPSKRPRRDFQFATCTKTTNNESISGPKEATQNISGLKEATQNQPLPPSNFDDTTDVITGKKVMTVGGPSESQAEAMLRDLKMLPPEELEKVTRELVTGLVNWNENIQKNNQAKGTDGKDTLSTY